MPKITTSKGSYRTLAYYTATVQNGPIQDEYWMRITEATSKIGSKLLINYWAEVRLMSDMYPGQGQARRSWTRLHSNGNQPIALDEIARRMSTPTALLGMSHPLWQDGITWQRVDSPPWTWV